MGDVVPMKRKKTSLRQAVRDNQKLTSAGIELHAQLDQLRRSNERLIRHLGVLVQREEERAGRCVVTLEDLDGWGKGSQVLFDCDNKTGRIQLRAVRIDEESEERG